MRPTFKSFVVKLILVVLVIYSLLGFIILPYFIQSNFSKLIMQNFNTEGYLGSVKINPFTFEISFQNMIIKDKQHKNILYFNSLDLDLEVTALFHKEIVLKYLKIDNLKTSIVLYKNNQFNFSHILKQLNQNSNQNATPEIQKETSAFKFVLEKFYLNNIRVEFEDKTKNTLLKSTIKSFSTTVQINQGKEQLDIFIDDYILEIPSIQYQDNRFTLRSTNIQHNIKNITINKKDTLTFLLDELTYFNQNIEFRDLVKNKNNILNFKDINLNLDKFSSNKNEPSQISLSLKTPKNGNINLETKAIQEPLNIDNKLLIKNFTISPYKAYVKDFINIDIKKTSLDIDSKILLTKDKQNVEADINISNIDLAHNLTNKNLLQLSTLNIEGLKYTNNNLFIKKVLLDDFSTSFKIDKQKNTNFDDLLVNAKKETKEKQKDRNSTFNYYIKELILSNGKANFSDYSLPLNFDTNIHSLHSTINDLSSKNTIANVDFQGVIEKYGLAKINAKTILSNFKNKTDVKVEFKNLDVISFSPYSGKFIGQKIADGRLWLDLNYQIRDAQLSSTNNIKIKNLTLGEDVESKDALSLPVGLAIALLEDGEGLIDLDVPVKGDMQEPEFELSGVIWKTVGNVITNIVTAPFRFLGSLLGIDSDELGIISFDFAKSDLLPPQKEKLDKLIEVFQKKKNLIIVLQPTFHKTEDVKYLKDIKFAKLTTSKDREKMIKEIYQKKFGTKKFKELQKLSVKGEFINTLSSQIKSTIIIPQNELDLLAKQRVINIKEYFLSHKLRLDRIQIKNTVFKNEDLNTKELSLKLELNIKD